MTGIPELFGSSAIWALSRIVEIGAERVVAFDNADAWLFLAGFGAACTVCVAVAGRAAFTPAARQDGSPAPARGPTATAAPPRAKTALSPYRTLSALIPDTEAREARIAELVDANGMTRLEAIARLVETLPSTLPSNPDTPPAPMPRSHAAASPSNPEPASAETHGHPAALEYPTARAPQPASVPHPPVPGFSPDRAEAEITARIPDASVRERLIDDRMSAGSARSRHDAILQILGMSIPSAALDLHLRALMSGAPGSSSPDAVGLMQPPLTRSK